MKIILIFVALILLSDLNNLVFAGSGECRNYEYAEIKDMDNDELKKEIKLTDEKYISNTKYFTNMLKLGTRRRELDEIEKDSESCFDQNMKLVKEENRRIKSGAIEKPKPQFTTYDECKKYIAEQGHPESNYCDFYFKKIKQK